MHYKPGILHVLTKAGFYHSPDDVMTLLHKRGYCVIVEKEEEKIIMIDGEGNEIFRINHDKYCLIGALHLHLKFIYSGKLS